MALRVLIADDHPIFRDGIQTLLATADDIVAVGEARTGEEAVELAATLAPDVILMDIRMPGCSGIEATRRIVAANHDSAGAGSQHVRRRRVDFHGDAGRRPRIHPQRR